MKTLVTRRIWSFIVGGLLLAAFAVWAIISKDIWKVAIGVSMFTFSSCFILYNNFIPPLFVQMLSFGFVKMPAFIIELDLDSIIFYLVLKLLFWILGIVVGIFLAILAFALGAFLSIFVYPFALVKNLKGINDDCDMFDF